MRVVAGLEKDATGWAKFLIWSSADLKGEKQKGKINKSINKEK